MGESQQVDPTNGTVAFGSALFGWAFTLTKFARTYSAKFKLDREKLMKKFWGDNYFSPTEKKFVTDCNGPNGELPRCFVQFIMKPIIMLVRHCMNGQMEDVFKMVNSLGLTLKTDEKEKRGKDLFKCVF